MVSGNLRELGGEQGQSIVPQHLCITCSVGQCSPSSGNCGNFKILGWYYVGGYPRVRSVGKYEAMNNVAHCQGFRGENDVMEYSLAGLCG